jgi:hypothetical protein
MRLYRKFGRLLSVARIFAVAAVVLSMTFSSTMPAFAAGGQTGNINGTVVDSASGLPVAGAKVNLVSPSGNYTTQTDSKGVFNILGAQVDTYTLSIEFKGYEPLAESGVTISGDQNVSLGTVKLVKSLRTIGTVTARSVNSAYQPGQTTDSITVAGSRIDEAVGKSQSNNERELVTSVPGATLTDSGAISIRGGLTTEVGYQFDGIPYSEPFLNQNSSANRFNGVGSLQIVEGAGDATQGNIGGGVVNIIPKRGTYPGFANLDFEIGGPNFNHTFDFEGGIASQDQRISDYFSYNGQRDFPYYGPSNINAASIGNYYAPGYQTNDDFVNNFVFRFGHNNSQSLQVLYQNRLFRDYGPAGGYTNQTYYTFDPSSYLTANGAESYLASVLGPSAGLAYYQHIIGLNQGVPSNPNAPNNLLQAELEGYDPTQLLKFEYDNNFTPNLLLQARYYNFNALLGSTSDTGALGGNAEPAVDSTGGRRSGLIADLIDQIGTKNTLTFHIEYQNQDPQFNLTTPTVLAGNLANNTSLQADGGYDAPSLADFLPLNANGTCSLNGMAPGVGGCYLSQFFPNGVPRIPIGAIGYHGSVFQTSAAAIRDQLRVNSRLNFDVGARVDGANYKIAPNPVTAGENNIYYADPTDVPLNTISSKFSNPRTVEPRAAVAFQVDPNDAVRASFGRSVEFLTGQTFGTPASLVNFTPFQKVPAVPGFTCGSGVANAPPVICTNYAQQLQWLYDQNNDAPDLGNALYAAYDNYDFTYQHQFAGGYGLRFTPFYRQGYDVPGFALRSATVNPVTQELESFVFTVNNNNASKTSGVEFELTTPQKPYGFSGFLSATYQNVLDRVTPLLAGEDTLPDVFDSSIALADTYRAGYVTPFTVKLGGEYKTKSGLRINPVVTFIRGYPFTIGSTVASNGLCGIEANVEQVNFGCGTSFIPGYSGVSAGFSKSGQVSTQYVDPALPGGSFNPNIAATRGTDQTAASGGVLSKAQVTADLDFEYNLGKRSTLGLLVSNLFGNQYAYSTPASGDTSGGIPQINPFYQPVATGVGGPQSGKNALANPEYAGGIFANRGEANPASIACGTCPYITVPTVPTTYTLYYQLHL